MSGGELDRLRRDLDVVQRAVGLGLPFTRADLRLNLMIAACGAAIAGWTAIVPWTYRWGALVILGLLVAALPWAASGAHRRRAEQPARWREQRAGIVAALVMTPLVVGYMRWERALGIPREAVGAAAVFFVGVALLVLGAIDRTRRHYVGGALPLMTFGLAIPFFSARGVMIGGGLCLMFAGLAAAAIQNWPLGRAEADDVAD